MFLSYTSEFREFPPERSFVTAATDAVARAGAIVRTMDLAPREGTSAADQVSREVLESDLYVGLLGFRYGSAVRDRPELSYMELEFDAATKAGLPRLIFLLDELAEVPFQFFDPVHQDRQEAFRHRVLDSAAVGTFRSPEQLEMALYQALVESRTLEAASVGASEGEAEPSLQVADPSQQMVGDRALEPDEGAGASRFTATTVDPTTSVRDLALSVSLRGKALAKAGRPDDAVAPSAEAVALYRQLAADSSDFLRDLASALHELGNRYGDLGRLQEAAAAAEEAVSLFRALVADDAELTSYLATALISLGNHYRRAGRRDTAEAAIEEGVDLLRDFATLPLPNLGTIEERPLAVEPEPVLVGNVDSDLVVLRSDKPLVDQLDVDTYIGMLCAVIAAADTPLPLSVGLFGEWGSGKSYFMALMQQRLDSLAAGAAVDRAVGRKSPYCSEIVQIRFNAWHYADANLWASLAVQIFDELGGGQERPAEERAELRRSLLHQLSVYRELATQMEVAIEASTRRAEEIERQLEAARDREEIARRTLDGIRATDIAKAVLANPRVHRQTTKLDAAVAGLGITAALDDFHALAGELRSLLADAGTVRDAWRDRGRRRALLLTLCALAVFVLVVLVVPGALKALSVAPLITAVAVAGRLAAALQRRTAAVRGALVQVETIIEVADNVRATTVEQRAAEVDRLQADINAARTEGRDLESKGVDARAQAETLSRQLLDLSAGRRLQQFIAERSASTDYRRQLGVVSVVRRDFEELTEGLRAAVEEHKRGTGPLPAIDRIVLYVDDLDRCPPARVVEVLEAVHLLLAMELFVVVVGVDPRWLLRSLQQHFRGVLTSGGGRGATSGDSARDGRYWESTPQNYLEKIFQIPFVLPSMSAAGYRTLLASLLRPGVDPAEPTAERPRTHEGLGADGAIVGDEAQEVPELGIEASSAGEGTGLAPELTAISAEPGSVVASMAEGGPPPRRLDLTPAEVDVLAALAPLVRTPPRRNGC